jgi:hypothetical protein
VEIYVTIYVITMYCDNKVSSILWIELKELHKGFYFKTFMGPTPAPRSPVSGRRYVAAALLGDGHAAWHLATSAEAVDRGLTMRSSDEICFPDAGG